VAEERKVGSVTYREVGTDYFQKRGLRRHAAFWSLWSLGVAAVISGDFYGWNAGLSAGGFGGLLIATVIAAIMYYGLCYSIAEMSPALPHTGGAYSFARSAMGPWGGFITGLAENMEYVITPAVVVGAMGFLMHDIMAGLFNLTGEPWWNSYVTWTAVFYVIFVGINIIGIEITMRFTVVINALALAILGFFLWPHSCPGTSARRTGRPSRPIPASPPSCRSGSGASSPPSRSPYGSSWRSKNFHLPPRSRTTRSGTSPGPRSGA
jgi:ethanolamine permease